MSSKVLQIQDFQSLRRECLFENKLFTDPCFPPEEKSIFIHQKPPAKFIWKRASEFVSDPHLFVEGASRFDVAQGLLGDCWLVSAMASLSQIPSLMKKVIPSDQSFSKQYAGIFHFKLWHFGEWFDIVVDDYLPTFNGKLVFVHSTEKNEFWSALLEKAYAKLHGSYEALKGGRTSEAMEDFTGGIQEVFDIQKTVKEGINIFKLLQKTHQRNGLICCSITNPTTTTTNNNNNSNNNNEIKLENGLVSGHAYTVTGINNITLSTGSYQLIRVRNPWGNEREWTGAWSDNSPEWNGVSQEERTKLGLTFSDDGEFWMSYADFTNQFTEVEICHSSLDTIDEDESVTDWNIIIHSGAWSCSKNTAGGCRNYLETFETNPQFIVDLSEDADNDGKCSILVALMQKDVRSIKTEGNSQLLCIGFSVYSAKDNTITHLDENYFKYNYSTGTNGNFINQREVIKRFDLDPGRYFIIPCVFKPNQEAEFLLRIFTEKASQPTSGHATQPSNSMHYNNTNNLFEPNSKTDSNAVPSKVTSSIDKLSLTRQKFGEQMFSKIAGKDGVVDYNELLDVLTAILSKDIKASVIQKDTCRVLIQLLDKNNKNALNYEEFLELIYLIGNWKSVFKKYDYKHKHLLDKTQLSLAFQELHYSLGDDCVDNLINRFGTNRELNFEEFMLATVRIKMINDNFSDTYKDMKIPTLNSLCLIASKF